jgi:membrane dipeptidase
MSPRHLSRRDFARYSLGAVAAGAFPASASRALASDAAIPVWPGYDDAFVLDFLASPGPFNTPVPFDRLTPEMVRNARASGITAVNLTIGGQTPEQVDANIAKWAREVATHSDLFTVVRSVAELRATKSSRKFGFIYGFQDTVAIGDDITRIARYHAAGVRVVQLTYNGRNLVGDGCLQPENAGLTPFGRQVVAELNARRIIVDTAHTGIRSTDEAIAASSAPIAISHSGCRAVADRPRSKPDSTIRMMAEKGGVIGIYMMPFLTMGPAPTSADLIRHIEHAINVAGEDHVGIGSDLSVTPHVVDAAYMRVHRTFVEGRIRAGVAAPGEDPEVPMFVTDLNSPRRMELIADRLAARGHGSARIEKVLGGNFLRLCRDVWGG